MVEQDERRSGKDDPPAHSRRAFLRGTGLAAAAGITGGAIAGSVATSARQQASEHFGFSPVPERSEPGFDHVVVLMFENRSFDSILGRLYDAGAEPSGQNFDGLAQGDYQNTAPDGTVVRPFVFSGSTDTIMSQPDPDPGEFYPHVNTQLFDVVDPESNENIWSNGLHSPYNTPRDDRSPSMSGFVHDYIINFKNLSGGKEPTAQEFSTVMGGFSPEMLPVLSTLARNFGVYDAWHSAVPSQTFCNRSFLHASTSQGFVTNVGDGGYRKWLDHRAETIFNRLEDAGISWRVYYDADQLVSLTGVLHAPAIEKYWKSNFRGMEQFHQDAADGNLPAYAFIEPRMVFNHNDMHPPHVEPTGTTDERDEVYEKAWSDIRAAEALLSEVYTSLKNAASATGSNAMNTVFVATFDEHGGIYDHAAPPRTDAPEASAPAGEMGFRFTRLGVRVPTIVVSPYVAAGTVINDAMHHSSVIATLNALHGLKPLTRRDAGAPTLFNSLTLKKPRQPAFWPDTNAAYVPPNPEAHPGSDSKHRSRALTPPARGLLGLLLAKYDPGTPVPDNYGDAYDILVKHGKGLFGVSD